MGQGKARRGGNTDHSIHEELFSAAPHRWQRGLRHRAALPRGGCSLVARAATHASGTKPSKGELVSLFGYGCNSVDGTTETESTGKKQRLDFEYGESKQVVCQGDSGGPAIYHGPAGDIFRVVSAVMQNRKVLSFGGGRADDAYGDVVKHRVLIRHYAKTFDSLSSDDLPTTRAD